MSDNENVQTENDGPTTPKRNRTSYSKFVTEFPDNKCRHCGISPKNLRACNAQRHLMRAHKPIYERLLLNENSTTEINDYRRNLALFIGTSSFAVNNLDNRYFKKLLSGVKNFSMPCPRTIRKLLKEEREMLQSNIAKIMDGATSVCLSADIATTKGMRYSYLGVIAHVWYHSEIFSVALDLVEMLDAHKAVYIRELVENLMREYRILPSKVFRITTDGAANMKAAFMKPFVFDDEDSAEIATDVELNDAVQMYTTNGNFAEPARPLKLLLPDNRQFKCAAHRLQLVLKDVFESNPLALEIRKIVFGLLGKFAKSHDATKLLYSTAKKKLLFPANTRWSSLQITYDRLLEISADVNKVAKHKGWPEISDADLERIKVICSIVTPFRAFTDKLQSENRPTISLLYNGLKRLINSLTEENREIPEINDALIVSIRTRFMEIVDSGKETGDPIYLVASYLDPRLYRDTQHENQDIVVETELRKLCRKYAEERDNSEIQTISASAEVFGFSVIYPTATVDRSYNAEISTFLADRQRPYFHSATAAEYWNNNGKVYPILRKVAYDVLCVPATSAAVERLFSQMTLNTTGHKGNTGPETTKTKVLMNYNQRFIS